MKRLNIKTESSGSLVIKESDSPGVWRDFIKFPYRLYRDNSYWVPPLLSEEKRLLKKKHNPFLAKNSTALYVCYRNNIPVGRIAAIENKDHNKIYKGSKVIFFGFFESVNDEEVAEKLFLAASMWAKQRGADILRGPTNFSLNDIAGLLVEGFNTSPYVMMPYNPLYYVDFYKKNGFEVAMRFFAYEVTSDSIKFPPFLSKLKDRLVANDIKIRELDFNYLEREAEIITYLFNNSWNQNWGFVPVKHDEAIEDFRKVKLFAKSDLIFIAEHKGRPVGFSLALPDINQALRPLKGRLLPFNWIKLIRNIKKIDRIRVILMGLLKEYRNRGIDLMFYQKTAENSLRYKYTRAELSWILENNLMMNRVLEHINAKKTKTYAIFDKKVEGISL